eukprot:751395-Hanusia_phi.AAC.8
MEHRTEVSLLSQRCRRDHLKCSRKLATSEEVKCRSWCASELRQELAANLSLSPHRLLLECLACSLANLRDSDRVVAGEHVSCASASSLDPSCSTLGEDLLEEVRRISRGLRVHVLKHVTGVLAWGRAAGGGSWRQDVLLPRVVGDLSLPVSSFPADLFLPFRAASHLSAGDSHVLAVVGGSSLWGWGANGHGQAHPSSRWRIRSPTAWPGRERLPVSWGNISQACSFLSAARPAEVQQVSAGGEHSLLLFTNGSVLSWGSNSDGQL